MVEAKLIKKKSGERYIVKGKKKYKIVSPESDDYLIKMIDKLLSAITAKEKIKKKRRRKKKGKLSFLRPTKIIDNTDNKIQGRSNIIPGFSGSTFQPVTSLNIPSQIDIDAKIKKLLEEKDTTKGRKLIEAPPSKILKELTEADFEAGLEYIIKKLEDGYTIPEILSSKLREILSNLNETIKAYSDVGTNIRDGPKLIEDMRKYIDKLKEELETLSDVGGKIAVKDLKDEIIDSLELNKDDIIDYNDFLKKIEDLVKETNNVILEYENKIKKLSEDNEILFDKNNAIKKFTYLRINDEIKGNNIIINKLENFLVGLNKDINYVQSEIDETFKNLRSLNLDPSRYGLPNYEDWTGPFIDPFVDQSKFSDEEISVINSYVEALNYLVLKYDKMTEIKAFFEYSEELLKKLRGISENISNLYEKLDDIDELINEYGGDFYNMKQGSLKLYDLYVEKINAYSLIINERDILMNEEYAKQKKLYDFFKEKTNAELDPEGKINELLEINEELASLLEETKEELEQSVKEISVLFKEINSNSEALYEYRNIIENNIQEKNLILEQLTESKEKIVNLNNEIAELKKVIEITEGKLEIEITKNKGLQLESSEKSDLIITLGEILKEKDELIEKLELDKRTLDIVKSSFRNEENTLDDTENITNEELLDNIEKTKDKILILKELNNFSSSELQYSDLIDLVKAKHENYDFTPIIRSTTISSNKIASYITNLYKYFHKSFTDNADVNVEKIIKLLNVNKAQIERLREERKEIEEDALFSKLTNVQITKAKNKIDEEIKELTNFNKKYLNHLKLYNNIIEKIKERKIYYNDMQMIRDFYLNKDSEDIKLFNENIIITELEWFLDKYYNYSDKTNSVNLEISNFKNFIIYNLKFLDDRRDKEYIKNMLNSVVTLTKPIRDKFKSEYISSELEDINEQSGSNYVNNILGGLYSSEISDMMQNINNFKGVYAADEILKIKNSNKANDLCFIMNTSPKRIKVGHWVAVNINNKDKVIEYYDSFGIEPSMKTLSRIYEIILKDKSINEDDPASFQLKINRVKHQSVKSDNCGYFAMKFLYDRRVKNYNFKKATGFDKLESMMNKSGKGEEDIKKFKKQIKEFRYVKLIK